jgi:ribonuclease I
MLRAACLLALVAVAAASSFDFLLVSSFWPAAGCLAKDQKSGSCHIPAGVDSFTMHGVWPSSAKSSSDGPQNCSGAGYNKSLITDLYDTMVLEWTDYLHTDPNSFWKHEWEKHGRCCIGEISALDGEHNYFQHGLRMLEGLSEQDVLASQGIFPSTNKFYSFQQIQAALKDVYGFQPFIQCIGDGTHNLLRTMNVCFDLNLSPMDCPDVYITAAENGCKGHNGQIYMLPFTTN